MIKSEKLYQMLHGGEFRPFRIHLKDGRRYDVINKHTALVGKTIMSIGTPLPEQRDKEWPVCEYMEFVNIADIDCVEMQGIRHAGETVRVLKSPK